MKEIPILFSAPMVRAIIEGRKTQTRRVFKHKIDGLDIDKIGYTTFTPEGYISIRGNRKIDGNGYAEWFAKCPYGKPGDILWVRETWRKNELKTGWPYEYRATAEQDLTPTDGPWKPSIFMPRAASRITLKVLDIRVERLQDISEADAIAEGVESWTDNRLKSEPKRYKIYQQSKGDQSGYTSCPIHSYQSLWESINGPGSWDLNPWVWVVKF